MSSVTAQQIGLISDTHGLLRTEAIESLTSIRPSDSDTVFVAFTLAARFLPLGRAWVHSSIRQRMNSLSKVVLPAELIDHFITGRD
jgi:hypothetical protein